MCLKYLTGMEYSEQTIWKSDSLSSEVEHPPPRERQKRSKDATKATQNTQTAAEMV